jgi:hypothetical protein
MPNNPSFTKCPFYDGDIWLANLIPCTELPSSNSFACCPKRGMQGSQLEKGKKRNERKKKKKKQPTKATS